MEEDVSRIGEEKRSCHLELWAGLLVEEGAADIQTNIPQY